MRIETIRLKEEYPFLAKGDADPILTGYIQPPARAERLRPAVIVIPGGGYTHYGKMEGDPIAMQFLAEGYQAFVLYYSVLPHIYPQQVREVGAALDHLVKNAADYGLDPEKIVLIGFSAGGHLANSYTSFCRRPEVLEHIRPHRVAATILGYPLLYPLTPPTRNCLAAILGKKDATEEELSTIIPAYHITEDTSPTFLWQTAGDTGTVAIGMLRYAEALLTAGVHTEVHIYPEGPHALSTGKWPTAMEPESNAARAVRSWVPLAMRWLSQLFHL